MKYWAKQKINPKLLFAISLIIVVIMIFFIFNNYRGIKALLKESASGIFSTISTIKNSCTLSFDDAHKQVQKYNHCNSTSDCTVVQGTMCGFHSGLLTNRNEIENVLPVINACKQDNCFEDFASERGYSCVNKRCSYNRDGSPGSI